MLIYLHFIKFNQILFTSLIHLENSFFNSSPYQSFGRKFFGNRESLKSILTILLATIISSIKACLGDSFSNLSLLLFMILGPFIKLLLTSDQNFCWFCKNSRSLGSSRFKSKFLYVFEFLEVNSWLIYDHI